MLIFREYGVICNNSMRNTKGICHLALCNYNTSRLDAGTFFSGPGA
jgi:hypothetical protein